MPTRRQVLTHAGSLGATATLGGCLWDFQDDSSLGIHVQHVSRNELGQRNVVAPDKLDPGARQVVEDGLANGTTVYGRKPLDAERFVLHDGTYYETRISRNGTGTVERPVLTAERVSSVEGPPGNRSALSQRDELAMRCAVASRDDRDAPPCVLYAGNDSAFWPDRQLRYVERGAGTYDRFSVAERNVTLDRYEYAFEPVAGNRSAFADYAARERVAIDFAAVDLSAEQRDILETAAAEGSYSETSEYSDALRALVDRLKSAGGNPESSVYVRFDGEYYEARYTQTWDI